MRTRLCARYTGFKPLPSYNPSSWCLSCRAIHHVCVVHHKDVEQEDPSANAGHWWTLNIRWCPSLKMYINNMHLSHFNLSEAFGNNTCKDIPDGSPSDCNIEFPFHRILFPVVYSVVFAIGLPSNIVALCLIPNIIQQGNSLGVYLLNLCISDLLYLLTLPFWASYSLQRHEWDYGETACNVAGFVFYTNNYVTILILCCISFERFLAIIFPFRCHSLRSVTAATLTTAAVWLLLLLAHVPLLTHSELIQVEQNLTLCFPSYPLEHWSANINYFRISVGFFAPLVILVTCYALVIHAASRCQGLGTQGKVKVVSLSLALIAICVITFAPYHIVLLVRTLRSQFHVGCISCSTERIVECAYRTTLVFTSFNSALDPFLHLFVADEGRRRLGNVRATTLRALNAVFSCCVPGPRVNSREMKFVSGRENQAVEMAMEFEEQNKVAGEARR
uniref:G protein-coupled receptor 68 n=1 Tax=Eptatretus burgeri TaxID=7764 RepID=A0A8C4PVT5_EPTBU